MSEPLGHIVYRAASILAALVALFAAFNFFDNLSNGEPMVPLPALALAVIIWLIGLGLPLRVACSSGRASAQHQTGVIPATSVSTERMAIQCATKDNMQSWKSISLCSQLFCSCRHGCLRSPMARFVSTHGSAQRIVAGVSAVALIAFREWEEWIACVLGLWIAVSPWVLGFQHTVAMFINLSVGILIAYLALLELWLIHYRSSSENAIG